jgi:hypothetical protein
VGNADLDADAKSNLEPESRNVAAGKRYPDTQEGWHRVADIYIRGGEEYSAR